MDSISQYRLFTLKDLRTVIASDFSGHTFTTIKQVSGWVFSSAGTHMTV